jgi:hypothetical protein
MSITTPNKTLKHEYATALTKEWYFEDYCEELDNNIEKLKQELDTDFDKETEIGIALMKKFKENAQFMVEFPVCKAWIPCGYH